MPLPDKVIPMNELKTLMTRFLNDEKRGISVKLFAEVAGLDMTTITKVFKTGEMPLTEFVQRRVSKALLAWQQGEIAVMRNIDGSKFVEYRKQPRMRMARTQKLEFVNGIPKISVGIRNKADYSTPDLDEQLRSQHGRRS